MYSMSVTMIPTAAVIQAQFADLGLGLRSLREPLKQAIQTVVSPSIRENFVQGGRPAWAELSESRLEQKAQQGYPDDTLIATGKLERVAGQLNAWVINGGYGSGEAEASFQNLPGAEYGFFHQEGTIRMPARPFAEIQEEDEEAIVEVFENYIDMRLARAGF